MALESPTTEANRAARRARRARASRERIVARYRSPADLPAGVSATCRVLVARQFLAEAARMPTSP